MALSSATHPMQQQQHLLVDFPECPRRRQKKRPKKRRVSFSDTSEVRYVLNLARRFKSELWFSPRRNQLHQMSSILNAKED